MYINSRHIHKLVFRVYVRGVQWYIREVCQASVSDRGKESSSFTECLIVKGADFEVFASSVCH